MYNTLKSIGTVAEVNGSRAKVVFKRAKACGECRACASFGSDEAVVEIANTLGAEVGDRVEIALHSSNMLKASFIMYGIPLAALLIGVYFGCKISDVCGALIGIGAAVIGLVVIRLFENRISRTGKFNPAMLAIIDGTEDTPSAKE